jgi:hypothetical protein
MDPNTRLMTMGAAGSGSSAVNFAATMEGSTFSVGGSSTSSAYDSTGDFYVASRSSPGGGLRTIIAKYSLLGILVWQIQLSVSSIDVNMEEIAIDSNKDIILVGNIFNPFSFTTTGVICKLNSSGNLLWSNNYQFGLTGVTTDSSNNIYVVGANRVLLTYSSGGTLQTQLAIRSPSFPSGDSFSPEKIKCLGSTLYISGLGTPGGSGTSGLGITKFTTGGSFISGNAYVYASSNATATNLTVDSSGNAYVKGLIASYGSAVVKYSSSNTLSWMYQLTSGGAGFFGGRGISIDQAGQNIYCFSNDGNYKKSAVQQIDVTSGSPSLVWSRSIGTASDAFWSGHTVSVANTGDVLVAQAGSIGSYTKLLSYLLPSNGSKTGTYLSTIYASDSYPIFSISPSAYSLSLTTVSVSNSTFGSTPGASTSSLISTIVNLT